MWFKGPSQVCILIVLHSFVYQLLINLAKIIKCVYKGLIELCHEKMGHTCVSCTNIKLKYLYMMHLHQVQMPVYDAPASSSHYFIDKRMIYQNILHTGFTQAWKVLEYTGLSWKVLENKICLKKYLKNTKRSWKVLEFYHLQEDSTVFLEC